MHVTVSDLEHARVAAAAPDAALHTFADLGLHELLGSGLSHQEIAIEPGLWQRGIGEVRLEDLLVVTEDGSETLTQYSYEVTPSPVES